MSKFDAHLNVTLEKVYNLLQRQRFADWYNSGSFCDHIEGAPGSKSKDEIIQDLKRMFDC